MTALSAAPARTRVAPRGALAVAIHDVEPASFRRCALIRDWLEDLGVDRATLLVIPAAGLRPFSSRSPELADWLLDRRDAGDAIAQHGLQHKRMRRPALLARGVRHWQGGPAAEFPGLDAGATAACLDTGRRLLTEAGVPPRGFVAPGYAYTPTLREQLAERYDWWATLMRVMPGAHAPALGLGTASRFKLATSPLYLRAGAATAGKLLRLDLHPADFDHPGHVRALQAVLQRASRRVAITYDDLC